MIEARRSPESARSALAKRRAEAEARAKDHIDILRAAAAIRRHQSVADTLERILVRGMRFVLDTAADILRPQPWAVSPEGDLLGHILTVDDAVFDSVAAECRVEILTLPDALNLDWGDLEQRSLWASAYVAALRSLADHEERKDRALREHDFLKSVVAEPKGGSGGDPRL
jgi:hypothetical protein